MNKERYDVGDVIEMNTGDYAIIISETKMENWDSIFMIEVLSSGSRHNIFLELSKIVIKRFFLFDHE